MPKRNKKRVSRRRQRRHRRTRKRQRGGNDSGEPPLDYTTAGAKIKVIIASNKRTPTLNALLLGLQDHKYSYAVIGVGRPWAGYVTKMNNLLEGVRKSLDSKYILILDGFDTFPVKDCSRLVSAFESRPRNTIPILIGAEHFCSGNCNKDIRKWHVYHRGEDAIANVERQFIIKPDVIESPTPYFLNSGCIVGPPNDIKWLLESMINSNISDDQLAACKVAIENPNKVDLDLEEKVFRNKIKSHERFSNEGGYNLGPGVLHFPGMRDSGQQETLLKLYTQF
jgi:hypothetical protein